MALIVQPTTFSEKMYVFLVGLLSWYFCTASVNSSQAPQITPARVPEVMEEGQRLSIMCAIFSGTLPISFSWRKDNVQLLSNDEMKITHVDDYQEILVIPHLTSMHVGNYTCSAKNAFGSDQTSVSVVLKYKPRWITTESSRILAAVGDDVVIDCTVRGHPSPTLHITKGEHHKYDVFLNLANHHLIEV